MTAPATVRRASPADAERLAPVFSLYREFYGQAADIDGAERFLRARLQRGESIVFVAEAEQGAVLGLLQVYPTFASVEMGVAWRLNDLYVAEAGRRAGVGQALMRAATEAAVAAGAVWIDLETARDNVTAQRLYEREGYTRDEQFIHYVKEL
jgi:ribosomal protein S18 acetylase RimI-like enzyme